MRPTRVTTSLREQCLPAVLHVMQLISVAEPAAGGSGADQRFTPLMNLCASERVVHEEGAALLPLLYPSGGDEAHSGN